MCPYQNLRRAAYPPLLATCSQSDQQVPYWGPLKYVARLRSLQAAAGRPALLHVDAHAGHFAHERDRFALKAQQYAFLLASLQAGTDAP